MQVKRMLRGRAVTPSGFALDETASAMAEFAVAAAIFTVLMLGIMEFGFTSWGKNSVAADAREGARYAIVHGSTSGNIATASDIQNYVRTRTSLDNSIVVLTTWNPDNSPGSIVTVKVKHAVPRRGPFIPAGTDSSISKMTVLF